VKGFFYTFGTLKNKKTMGKGDKRSRKGKVWRGSYGNTRRKKKGTKPAFVPKPKPRKIIAPVEASLTDIGALETIEASQGESKTTKPKKAAPVKKAKAEGEKKAVVKKEPKKKAPAEKKK
jgi:30S ribosomal protein S31